MQKVFPIASMIVIIGLLAAVTVETREIASLKDRLQQAEARLAANANEPSPASDGKASETAKSEGEASQSPGSEGTGPAATATGETQAGAASKKSKPTAAFGESFQKMMTDPDMKKVMRQQQALGIRMMYGDFIKQLHLSNDDADRFIDLLSDRQMASVEMMGKASEDGLLTVAKTAENSRADFDAKLKDMVGPDTFKQFEGYEKTIGDRMMLQQYQQLFSGTAQPLDDTQRSSLLQIMIDERAKMPPSPFDQTNKDVTGQLKAPQSDQAMHDFLAQQGELNQRVYQKAAEVLSPDQLASFQKFQQQMTDMQQMGLKMGKQMMKQ